MGTAAHDGAGGSRDQEKEIARIAAFSDAVFAIAITLLALPLAIPLGDDVDVWAELRSLWPTFLSFVISFAVIGSYWVGHHRLFAVVVRYDRRLLWLNLLSLFFIVLLPFTTSLVGEHGGDEVAVAVYALSLAAGGLAATMLTAYVVSGRRLCSDVVDGRLAKLYVWRTLATALIFVASLALLPLGTSAVEYSWLTIIVALWLVRRRYARPGEI